MYSPVSEYDKKHDRRILNENSTIPIKEKEPSKYKRVRQKVPERPLSQISGKDVEKLIENFECYRHNYHRNSSDLIQNFSLSLKDPNPGKYRRQQTRITERPNSQTSWEEIDKHMKSFELKINNPSFYNSENLDRNHRPQITRKNLEEFDREEIRSIGRSRSKNIKHKIEKYSLEAENQSNSKTLNCDVLGVAMNPGQSTGEKKYKRSQRCVAERPFSQPSIKETEKYVKSHQTWKNSPILESNFGNFNLENGEKNSKEIKKLNPEKYQRKSQFTKRSSSQISGTKIKEFIEIFEPETQCFYGAELNLKELDNQEGNLNKPDRKIDSPKYEGNQSGSADKSSFQFLRTRAGKSVEHGEQDAQVAFHKTEEFEKNDKLENSNVKFKKISQRYCRNHVRNTRSASAPPIFIQTNVPNYFQCSQIDNSKNGIARMKQNHNKESKNADEAFLAEPKCHEIPKCKTTNTDVLLDEKYKSEDLAMPEQKQSHVKNGYSEREKLKTKEGKYYIPDFLVLESIHNRRPNKKVNEVILDGNTVKSNTDLKSEKYSRINKQNQRERQLDSSEIFHKTTIFDLENTHMKSCSSREIEEISSGDISEKIPKTIKFDQNNNKINQLLMDGVQTNAPLYHLKLSYERKRSAPKEKEHKEASKILNGYKNNMHYHSSSRNPENEIPVNKKCVLGQNENQTHFAQSNKDMVPVADNITQPLLKKKRSFFTYQNLETNINSTVPDSSEHSSDKNSFQIVAERNKSCLIEKSTENLDSLTDGMSSHAGARNSQKQSSEIGKRSAKLDWSISEISVIENEEDDDKLFGIRVDEHTLSSPDENKSCGDDHKFSEKSLSNSFGDFSKELKRTFSSSQLNKNSPNVNKKLESLSKENGIDGVKCRLMLRKYFFLWKKKWRKHLAARILWKRHSLRKGINALRQASQNNQIVSGVLQERIQKVWLRSCFQKWKRETSIKLWDQLAAAFKKWKENAKEQNRFQTLKDIHHRNVLLLCFQKWRSHYKSNIMLLRALMHHRMSLLYSVWHHWIQFVKQNQQKKFWRIMARKYQRKKLQSRTMKGLTSAYKHLIKAKLHYRSQKMRMVLQFWRKGAAISSHQSQQIVAAVQLCSNQLALRRTVDIWVHQLWLIRESRRADQWILSRCLSFWHKKWCCIVAWRQTVVAKIEHQHTRAVLHKWHKNVHLQKEWHKLATKQVQKVLLMQLLTKWKRLAKRQVETRRHLQIQVSSSQYQTKYQFFLIWKDKFEAKQKARQVYYLWSEQCVRKAVNRWKDSHNQATTNKKAFQFEPLRNLLRQKGVFWRWKHAWQKANEEEAVARRCHAILQQRLLGTIFHKWHSRTQGTLAVKPLVQRRRSQLLLHVFRAWHRFLWEKHQRTKNSFQLQNYHLKQLFHKWRNVFILREKETRLSIHHGRRFLRKCMLGWRLVIQRKNKAKTFHQALLLRKFFSWREKTIYSLRCKAMKEAVQHSCRTVQRYFFNQWRQNAIQQKIRQTKSTKHIEKIHRRNVLIQALTSWRHLLKIQVIARNHYKHRLAILMQQILVKWHSFTEYSSCLAVRCLQRRLHLDARTKCLHTSRDHVCCWQQEDILQQENGSTREDSHLAYLSAISQKLDDRNEKSLQGFQDQMIHCLHPIIENVDNLKNAGKSEATNIGHLKVMTRMILQLKYWPVSVAFLQWRRYTQLCVQLKTRQQQLHVKNITVVLSTTFGLWRQQQQAFKLARHHQELILMKKTFRELWNYAVNRRSKKALLARAKKYHHATVFQICFIIWQKKVKQKEYWDKVAKLLEHCMPEERLLQPLEFRLTSLLGQRSLHACFRIWQETYREASFYRQHYYKMLLIRYLHIWRSWALYRRYLSQKCNVFRKRRIQLLALQLWIRRLRQHKWIQKTQRQKVNIVLLTVLRQWHNWSSKSCRQKAAEAKVKHNHVTLMLSQVFTSLTREFHKMSTACLWYQNKLITKVIAAWFYRSQFQINERVKVKTLQQQKVKTVMQRILNTWKRTFQLRCEAKFNREQRIHLKVCGIVECWKRKAKKSRGKILETVFTERVVRFCFFVWRNRFGMMKQLEGRLHVFASWKQQQTQTHLFTRWRSTLSVTRADQTYKCKLFTKVFNSWQMCTKASLLYQRRFHEYQTIQQKRQLKSTFRNWKIRWRHKRISTKLFKRNIKTRALKAWYDYVQGQLRLKILRAYLADRLSTRHLLSTYHKWKGRVTSCMNERRKEKQQAILAEQHYKTRLSMAYFHIWHQETLVSRCIVRRRMHLANKYCNRWKYHTDLSYTASLWREKQSYYRIWCKWRAAFIREKTAAVMEAEFRRQNLRQIFRIWYQYCRYKKIHEKEKLFPGICLNLENI